MAEQSKKPQSKQSTPQRPSAGGNRRAAQKKKKTIIISAVATVLVIAIIVTIVLVAQRNNMPETTRITTYNIDEITYGNVSTTISGTGLLSPITKATLTLADCLEEEDTDTETETETGTETETETETESESESNSGTSTQSDSGTVSGATPGMPSIDTLPTITGVISDIAVSVGDTVAEGDVIAVVTFDDGDDRD